MQVSKEPKEKIEEFFNSFKQLKTSNNVKKTEIDSIFPQTPKTEISDTGNSLQGLPVRVKSKRKVKEYSKVIRALQIQARNGVPGETMEAMIALLRKGGWKDAKSLPPGWMIKKRTILRSKNGDYTLCSRPVH